MVELTLAPDIRAQLAAVARVRWQLFVNSLRTIRGRLEFVSHIFISLGFAIGGIGGLVASGAGAWYLVSRGETEWLAAILWPIFLFWQLFPRRRHGIHREFRFIQSVAIPNRFSRVFHDSRCLRVA